MVDADSGSRVCQTMAEVVSNSSCDVGAIAQTMRQFHRYDRRADEVSREENDRTEKKRSKLRSGFVS